MGWATALDGLGYLLQYQGEFFRARVYFEEALGICRELGNKSVIARSVGHLARLARYEGDHTLARKLSEENLALARELGIKLFVAQALQTLGDVVHDNGNSERALDCFKEAIALYQDVGDKVGILECLEAVANTVGVCKQAANSVRLFGIAAAMREAIGAPLLPADRAEYDRRLAVIRAKLDMATFTATWAAGQTLSLDEAIAEGLQLCTGDYCNQPDRAVVPMIELGAQSSADLPRVASTAAATLGETPSAGTANVPLPTVLRSSDIPIPPTPLLGRQHDLRTAQALLERPSVRLLTLVGPPGVGKTRLALALAASTDAAFADGVVFVALAAIQDLALVLPTIAQALNVHELAHQSLLTLLTQYLCKKQLLLVLDNVEQIVAAGPQLAELLTHAPGLTILATSRMPLHISGEHEYPVQPLPVFDSAYLPTTGDDPRVCARMFGCE